MKKIFLPKMLVLLLAAAALQPLAAQQNWRIDGNAGTTDNHFLGTTDNRPFRLRTNNAERLLITAGGNFGIGTTTTSQRKFSIADAGNLTTAYFLNTANAVGGFTTVGLWSEVNNNGAGGKRAAYFYSRGFNGTNYGLFARAENALHNYALYADANGSAGGSAYGLLARVTNQAGSTGYGVKVEMIGGGTQFAGHFGGRVYVSERIGIGTENPDAPLQFANGNGQKITFSTTNIGPNFGIGLATDLLQIHSHGSNSDIAFGYGSSQNFTERMRVRGNGNVGIGIAAPATRLHVNGSAIVENTLRVGTTQSVAGYALVVDGKAICEELKVKLSEAWPDYVFDAQYPLRPLGEVEQHIRDKGHLPGLPPAAEVTAAGGVELGEMNRRLVEKVEELTLYILALEKRIKALEETAAPRLNKN